MRPEVKYSNQMALATMDLVSEPLLPTTVCQNERELQILREGQVVIAVTAVNAIIGSFE